MCHDNEEWCKIRRKTDLLFEKWQEFGEFWPEHSKFLKFPLWLVPFVQSIITFELSFMTLKCDAKFKEKLTCGLENDTRNMAIFHQDTWDFGLCWDPFIQSRICMGLKFTEELLSWQWRMMQNLKRNWLVVSKLTWRIWQILIRALKSLKNLHFNELLFWAKKYRGVMFHDSEEWCEIWRKTDLWFGKWYEEFGKFLPEHSKVLKVGLWWEPAWAWTLKRSYASWQWRMM